jgi:hypothetical protein
MQLGRAYMKAGKKTEAAHAFTRVVEEFPDISVMPPTRGARWKRRRKGKGRFVSQARVDRSTASMHSTGALPTGSIRRAAPAGTNTISPSVRITDSSSIVTLSSPERTASGPMAMMDSRRDDGAGGI